MLRPLLLLFPLLLLTLSSNYTKHTHAISSGARCSDGSPSSLLYHIPSPLPSPNILIYFVGGGFCSGTTLSSILQSCY